MVSKSAKRDPDTGSAADSTSTARMEHMRSSLASNNPEIMCAAFEMATHLMHLPQPTEDKGRLELECSLGMGSQDGKRLPKNWQPSLGALDTQMILTALERGEAQWASVDEDWRLVYDTYVQMPSTSSAEPCTRARLRNVDGISDQNITKTLLARADFNCPNPTPLHVRFQAKLERQIQSKNRNPVMLLPPESVRVSMRRSFEMESESMLGVTYRFTVVKAWTGRTAKEAEMMMHALEGSPGENGVEVEVELEWPCTTPERLLYSCLGVLIKTQDLVQLLSGDREMKKITFVKLDDVGKTVKIRKSRKRSVSETSAVPKKPRKYKKKCIAATQASTNKV
jgi:hypothetical protein